MGQREEIMSIEAIAMLSWMLGFGIAVVQWWFT